ncbi:peptidase T [Anatilimnocola floriformis]|uniref:peptidase T n=1 Tax=Anatilimnocola floriformis TaxID=2948575 RepID=UPI0020C20AD9|nr:peptidase T [Anatilimnocola floriformis]
MINPERLLARFLSYVQLDTTAGEPGGVYPSSPGQLLLGKILADELRAMGAADVEFTDKGLVYATVPSTLDAAATKSAPVVTFNAHVDTSPETTGKDVKPQVIRNYVGGDIVLPKDTSRVIRVAQNPELAGLKGKTLVTTDGTTLLGADDKSGIAVIMEMAQHLIEQPELKHGPVRILFTCDEEIGHGIDHVDLKKLGATVCYTLDGAGAGEVDVETFSADLATVKITGINIHPSIAKDRMVNSLRALGTFLDRLPRAGHSPETTDGRSGFLHPYDLHGGVAESTVRVLLRDFDTAGLGVKAELLKKLGKEVEAEHPGCKVDVQIKKQYRNLGDGLAKEPRAAAYAVEAHRRLGREAKLTIIRGGTDGSQLTERGLPTPNLSTGEHNPHSPLEWTCLEEMVAATEVCTELVQVWAKG